MFSYTVYESKEQHRRVELISSDETLLHMARDIFWDAREHPINYKQLTDLLRSHDFHHSLSFIKAIGNFGPVKDTYIHKGNSAADFQPRLVVLFRAGL